ncbi:MAG: hypothetical protein KatS3mg096_337 [Candidatus Parcubacteria bacterium]|nr:MAG: hypothetical protein KatS3mg096_337 [Candidatus Parcubacteria bacterium]
MPRTTKQNKQLELLVRELRDLNRNLRMLIFNIPEESLKEYKNRKQIIEAFNKAIKLYPRN